MGAFLLIIGIIISIIGFIGGAVEESLRVLLSCLFAGGFFWIPGAIILMRDEFFRLHNRVEEKESDVEVSKRKFEDIEKKLCKIVNDYINTEKSIMSKVHSKEDVLALAENFPELSSNTAVQELLEQLSIHREKVASEEGAYNGRVRAYHNWTLAPSTAMFRPKTLSEKIEYKK